MALALQLNHEENSLLEHLTKPDTKSIDSQTTFSLTDSQVFDSISGKMSMISDKTSKCNLYLGDSPLPSRSGRCDSPRDAAQPSRGPPYKKDSLSSLRADNISNLSYSVWERGSIGTNELASLSDVSSLCNLICMETGRSGVMSRSHSPAPSARSCGAAPRPGSPAPSSRSQTSARSHSPEPSAEKEEKEKQCSVSLQLFALLLDNVNVQRKYLHFKSNSLPNLSTS